MEAYYEKMLALAETIAVNAHKSQLDKGGHPYINHPRFVSAHCTSPESRIVGMLHDVVEDTDVTLDALREYGFNEDILMAIDLVTKKKGPDYDEDLYYEKNKNKFHRKRSQACRFKAQFGYIKNSTSHQKGYTENRILQIKNRIS